jgi:hypothetical protein
MSSAKNIIQSAIQDVMDGNSSSMKDKINTSLYAKVADVLKTKKMEISNDWLSSLTAAADEEEEERNNNQ